MSSSIEYAYSIAQGGVFAGDFLHRKQFSQLLRGRVSATLLLAELLDAHESVLNTAPPTGTSE
jgi:hypothetical protein